MTGKSPVSSSLSRSPMSPRTASRGWQQTPTKALSLRVGITFKFGLCPKDRYLQSYQSILVLPFYVLKFSKYNMSYEPRYL